MLIHYTIWTVIQFLFSDVSLCYWLDYLATSVYIKNCEC